jgi:predicted O-methyltransferase YrrM
MQSWRQLPEMKPFVEMTPLETDEGPSTPHSCSTFNNLTVLQHLFNTSPVGDTLEIGLAFGASATLLCKLHALRGDNTRHHAIDPYQISQWKSAALKHLLSCELSERLVWHEKPSFAAMAGLVQAEARFSLIYIDGSHLFEHVMSDFMLADLLTEPGAVLAFDDSSCDHVAKVVCFIRQNFKEEYAEESPYAITAPSAAWWKGPLARALGKQQLTIFRKLRASKRAWGTPLTNF